MKQMLADIKAHKPDQEPDYYFAFGYNQARAMTALLEKAVELGDLSRDGILKARRSSAPSRSTASPATTSTGRRRRAAAAARRTIFEIDPKKPFGLKRLEYQYESDAAGEYEFTKADL